MRADVHLKVAPCGPGAKHPTLSRQSTLNLSLSPVKINSDLGIFPLLETTLVSRRNGVNVENIIFSYYKCPNNMSFAFRPSMAIVLCSLTYSQIGLHVYSMYTTPVKRVTTPTTISVSPVTTKKMLYGNSLS